VPSGQDAAAALYLEHPGTLATAISPDASWVVTSSHATPGLRVWSLPEGRQQRTLLPDETILQALATPDGRRLIVRATNGPRVFRTSDWTETTPPPPGTRLDSMTASPDGRWLASVGDNEIHLLRAEDFAPSARLILPGHVGWLGESQPVFDGESRRLLIHTALGSVVRWDLHAMEAKLAELGMGQ
jgi:WD40 repeat protein